MQQWLDNSIPENSNNATGRIAVYNSPVSDAFSEGSNFYPSPAAVANEESGLSDVSAAVFPQNVESSLPAVSIADLLLITSSTATESVMPAVVADSQRTSSTRNPAVSSQLPDVQLK